MTLIEGLTCSASTDNCGAADICKREGNIHFASKDFAAAIKCYSEAIKIDASNHVLFGNRSAAFIGNVDWKNAAADARFSVELNAGYTKGFYRMAQAYLGMGDVDSAATAIKSGLRVDPVNKDMLRLARKVDDMGGRSGLRLRKGRQKNHFQGGSNSSSVNSEDGTKPRRVGSWRALEKLSLYDDKEDLHDDADQGGLDGDTRALRKIFRTLRDSVDAPGSALGFSGRPHELEGVFRQLVNPEAFRRIVTLGLSEEERGGVPKTFQELLRSPLYSAAVEEALPRVVAQAASVLDGVKERGRKEGDVMDTTTEEGLRPQILQEAFARAVVSVVSAVHARTRAKAVLKKAELASPDCEEASWDQLEGATVSDVMATSRAFAVQDKFMCADEWDPVFLDDCVRFADTGQLSADPTMGHKRGKVAWVEPNATLESTFPALNELLLSLHALAFELNRKAPDLALARPCRGSTMLLRLHEGCRLSAQMDSHINGTPTGHEISCVYFVGCRHTSNTTGRSNTTTCGSSQSSCATDQDGSWGGEISLLNVEAAPIAGRDASREENFASATRDGQHPRGTVSERRSAVAIEQEHGSGSIVTDLSPNRNKDAGDSAPETVGAQKLSSTLLEHCQGQSAVVEPTSDRLVLYRSDRVSSEMLEVRGQGREQYVVRFWIHTGKESTGSGGPHGDVLSVPTR